MGGCGLGTAWCLRIGGCSAVVASGGNLELSCLENTAELGGREIYIMIIEK